MHDRVHSDGRESRGTVRIEFSVPIRSFELGVTGQADVVEYHLTDIQNVNVLNEKIMLPVKGKTKKYRQARCRNDQSIPGAEQEIRKRFKKKK